MDRKSIPFTNEHFAAFCEKMLGQPYWFGCCLYKCTESLRSRKAEQYPSHYGTSRTTRYKQDIAAKKVCADCIGGIKGYAWTGGGIGVLESIGTDKPIPSKYGSNGCPDKGANSMFTYAKQKGMDWGTISTLPEIVGLALHKDGHVGIYVGDGYAVEWRGYADGCIKTKVAGRGWTHWYRLTFIQYGAVTAPEIPNEPDAPEKPDTPERPETPETPENPGNASQYDFGSRLLRYRKGRTMLKGGDVLAVQARLIDLGFDPGKADGVYGPNSAAGVAAFQAARRIDADGIVGPITRTELAKD